MNFFSSGLVMLKNTLILDMRCPLLNCWPRVFKKLPKCVPIAAAFGPPQRKMTKYCSRHHTCTSEAGHRNSWAGTYLKDCSLRTRFHGKRRPCKLPKEGSNQQSYPALTPMNHSNDWHSTMTAWCNTGVYTLVVTSRFLIVLKTYSTRGIPCSILKTANYSMLVKSWLLESTTSNLPYQHKP